MDGGGTGRDGRVGVKLLLLAEVRHRRAIPGPSIDRWDAAIPAATLAVRTTRITRWAARGPRRAPDEHLDAGQQRQLLSDTEPQHTKENNEWRVRGRGRERRIMEKSEGNIVIP